MVNSWPWSGDVILPLVAETAWSRISTEADTMDSALPMQTEFSSKSHGLPLKTVHVLINVPICRTLLADAGNKALLSTHTVETTVRPEGNGLKY